MNTAKLHKCLENAIPVGYIIPCDDCPNGHPAEIGIECAECGENIQAGGWYEERCPVTESFKSGRDVNDRFINGLQEMSHDEAERIRNLWAEHFPDTSAV